MSSAEPTELVKKQENSEPLISGKEQANPNEKKASHIVPSMHTDLVSFKEESQGQRRIVRNSRTNQQQLHLANSDLLPFDDSVVPTSANEAGVSSPNSYSQIHHKYLQASRYAEPRENQLMLKTIEHGAASPVFNAKMKFPGNHRRTKTLNLEFQGSENRRILNKSFVLKSGSDRDKLLRILSANPNNQRFKQQARRKRELLTSQPPDL